MGKKPGAGAVKKPGAGASTGVSNAELAAAATRFAPGGDAGSDSDEARQPSPAKSSTVRAAPHRPRPRPQRTRRQPQARAHKQYFFADRAHLRRPPFTQPHTHSSSLRLRLLLGVR